MAASVRETSGPNWNLTSDEVAKMLHVEMVDKTVIITGVSKNGLGAEAARVISQHNPKLLILASRTESAIAAVIEEIKPSASSNADIRPLVLDLGSQKSVRAAAVKVLEMTSVVDVLINNAGILMPPKYSTTPEGIELSFGVNHIGHFLFTNLIMLALLKSASGPRVVNISSYGTRLSGIRFGDVCFGDGKNYVPLEAYGQSKTANLLFSLSLANKLGKRNLCAFGVDPGAVPTTQLPRSVPKDELVERGWFLENGEPNPDNDYITAAQSVASYIMAAYDPVLKEYSGLTIYGANIHNQVPAHSTNPDIAERLWKLSEKLVGEEFHY